jgi:formate dehydrogenase iron-sulfur subunit
LDELVERARERCEHLVESGVESARLYGDDSNDGVGGFGAFFLLLDDPEVYGLPPDPVDTTKHIGEIWGAAAGAAVVIGAAVFGAIAFGAR